MLPISLNTVFPCVSGAVSLRIFSDLVGQYMARDDPARAIEQPVNDYAAWLEMATGCSSLWIARSLYSLTAAAAAGITDVHVLAKRNPGHLLQLGQLRNFTCDAYVPLQRLYVESPDIRCGFP